MVSKKKLKKRIIKLKKEMRDKDRAIAQQSYAVTHLLGHIEHKTTHNSNIPSLVADVVAYITERIQDDYANKEGVSLTEDGHIKIPRDYFEKVITPEIENHFNPHKPNISFDTSFKPAKNESRPFVGFRAYAGPEIKSGMIGTDEKRLGRVRQVPFNLKQLAMAVKAERKDSINKRNEKKSLKEAIKASDLGHITVEELFSEYDILDAELTDALTLTLQKIKERKEMYDILSSGKEYVDPSTQVLLVEGGNTYATPIPIQNKSLKEVLQDTGFHISNRNLAYALTDFLKRPKPKGQAANVTTQETAIQFFEYITKDMDLNLHGAEDIDYLDFERCLTITSEGEVRVITIAKKNESGKPFEV